MKNSVESFRAIARGFVFVFTLLLCSFSSAAQSTFVPYKPTDRDSLVDLMVAKRFKAEKDTISFAKKEGKAFITEQCSLRAEYIKAAVKDEMFLTGSFIDKYVKRIVEEIERGNPGIKGRITVLVSRDPEPNAYSLGNGFVIMNIGMLYQVNSEAEIAFILCHEFAHDIFRHGNESLYKTAARITDEELKKQLETTIKEEYNTKKKVIDLLMPGLKKSRQYSRELELQADSLGLELLKNTAYSQMGAITGMDVLDSLDNWDEAEDLNLKTFFTVPQVPAKNSWFEYHGGSSLGGGFGEEKDTLADSLKTHPDCKLRKEKLSARATKSGKSPFVQTEEDFKRLKFETDGEMIQLMLDWQNIDYSVYYSMFSLLKYPANTYPRSVIALCLAFLSKEKKNLSSSKWMRYNSPDFSDNFNHVLYFLIELHPDDCAALAYWMLRPEKDGQKENEIQLAALTLSAYSAGKTDEYKTLRSKYDVEFPKGRYASFLPALDASRKKK